MVIIFDFSWFVNVMTLQVLLVILIITPLLQGGAGTHIQQVKMPRRKKRDTP